MGRVMFFLLRMTFWIGLVCVLLPSGSNTPSANIDTASAVSAASAAVSDMRGFCERQPEACVVGGKVAVALGHKAEAGARTLIQFVTSKMSEPSTGNDAAPAASPQTVPERPALTTASVPATERGTLAPADLKTPWHPPVPMPPRREARAGRPSA